MSCLNRRLLVASALLFYIRLGLINAVLPKPSTSYLISKSDEEPKSELINFLMGTSPGYKFLMKDSKKIETLQNLLEFSESGWLQSYLDRYNTNHKGSKATLLDVLIDQYTEHGLVWRLEVLLEKNVKNSLVEELQSQLLEKWVDQRRPFYSVFKIVINRRKENFYVRMLTIRQIRTLANYIDLYNHKYNTNHSLVDVFISQMGEVKLLNMLAYAFGGWFDSDKAIKPAEKLAIHVQTDLLNDWVAREKNPENIFGKHLKFKVAFKWTLVPEDRNIISLYLSKYNKKPGVTKTSLLQLFVSRYGDKIVATNLARVRMGADENHYADCIKESAAELSKQQMKSWLEQDYSIEKVTEIFKNSEFGQMAVLEYTTLYNKMKSTQ